MVPTHQVKIFIIRKKGGTIPQRREQRIEASVKQRRHLEIPFEVSLISLQRLHLYWTATLLFNFLELSDFLLPQFISRHGQLVPQVATESRVEFAVVVVDGGAEEIFAVVHLDGDGGEGFIAGLRLVVGFWAEGVETGERGGLLEQF